jgi:hypothetical protein
MKNIKWAKKAKEREEKRNKGHKKISSTTPWIGRQTIIWPVPSVQELLPITAVP